jgi:protein tyrosine phosphatase
VEGDDERNNSSDSGFVNQNWSPSGSAVRSTALKTPAFVPLQQQPQYDEFRRQAESYTFRQSSLTGLTRSNTRDSSSASPEPEGPEQRGAHVSAARRSSNVDPMDSVPYLSGTADSSAESDSGRDYLMSGKESSFSPSQAVPRYLQDERLTRLSLPNAHDATSSLNSSSDSIPHAVQRASTLPTNTDSDISLLAVTRLSELLDSSHHPHLLIDFRTAALFMQSRLPGALNLCIPTMLIKRPSYGVERLASAFEKDKRAMEHFLKWKKCKYIIGYDSKSDTLKDADMLVHVMKKFIKEGFSGQCLIVKGGYEAFAKQVPQRIDRHPVGSGSSSSRSSSVDSAMNGATVANVAGGCLMPKQKTAANPFFSNIRQNMDLIGGVGQIAISRPSQLDNDTERLLPRWMQNAIRNGDRGKEVAEMFYNIEVAEKKRMEGALSMKVAWDNGSASGAGSASPGGSAASSFQLAGVEKGAKNRYNNIWPYDHARVRLQQFSPDSCDYINASHISTRFSKKRYIASQAPLPATFNDFWASIWDQDVRVIVMLTAEQEGGQVKCHPYWKSRTYGNLKLKVLSERKIAIDTEEPKNDSASSEASDNVPSRDDRPYLTARTLALTHTQHPFVPMREITQIQYSAWPDFGTPTSPRHLLGVVRQVDRVIRLTSAASPNSSFSSLSLSGELAAAGGAVPAYDGPQRPVLVHCSAGCGRTGTFCTVDSVLDYLRHSAFSEQTQAGQRHLGDKRKRPGSLVDSDDEIDIIAEVVAEFRSQRLSMVQTLRQYVLCYESVLDWMVGQMA